MSTELFARVLILNQDGTIYFQGRKAVRNITIDHPTKNGQVTVEGETFWVSSSVSSKDKTWVGMT